MAIWLHIILWPAWPWALCQMKMYLSESPGKWIVKDVLTKICISICLINKAFLFACSTMGKYPVSVELLNNSLSTQLLMFDLGYQSPEKLHNECALSIASTEKTPDWRESSRRRLAHISLPPLFPHHFWWVSDHYFASVGIHVMSFIS